MLHGITARPADTLLVERARDFLSAGPADAVLLAERVCQMQRVSLPVAEQVVATLLAGRTEFVRDDLGWWRLAGTSPAPVQAPRPEPAPERAAVPSFDEWMAERRAADRVSERVAERPVERADRPGSATPAAHAAFRPTELPADLFDEPVPKPLFHGPRRRRAFEPEPVAEPVPGADEPLSSLSWVVVDVETTGGNPHTGHRITEIAAVTVREGRVQEQLFESLVNPERSIPPMITALTHITWEMVRDKPRFREICPDLVRALEGHVFVAHNAAFDWKFVTHEIERASGQRIDGRRLCTVRLARRLLPQLPRRSLDWVARHYGVDIAARHRAAGDAVATAHCLVRLLKDAESKGIRTWGELDMLLNARTGGAKRLRKSQLSLPRSARGDESA